MLTSVVKCSWVKRSEGLSKWVSNIITRYRLHDVCCVYGCLSHSFIVFFTFLIIVYMVVLYASVLCIVSLCCVYRLCKRVLYYCQRLSTQLQLTNKSRVPGIFLWRGGRSVGLTNLPPSCAQCLETWEPQPPGTLRASPGL